MNQQIRAEKCPVKRLRFVRCSSKTLKNPNWWKASQMTRPAAMIFPCWCLGLTPETCLLYPALTHTITSTVCESTFQAAFLGFCMSLTAHLRQQDPEELGEELSHITGPRRKNGECRRENASASARHKWYVFPPLRSLEEALEGYHGAVVEYDNNNNQVFCCCCFLNYSRFS